MENAAMSGYIGYVPPLTQSLQPDELVSPKEAAAILGSNERTLANWRTLKQGPRFVKLGARMVRYHRTDLAAFLTGAA
jgi:predicted DNA-binding transcriptional regulator AlpA